MGLQFAFHLITRVTAWLRLSRREEAWQTAEILILRHQLAILQRRQPRHPHLNWADRALPAALLSAIPKARRQGLKLLVTPDTSPRVAARPFPLARTGLRPERGAFFALPEGFAALPGTGCGDLDDRGGCPRHLRFSLPAFLQAGGLTLAFGSAPRPRLERGTYRLGGGRSIH
jgi:hypothetical protein